MFRMEADRVRERSVVGLIALFVGFAAYMLLGLAWTFKTAVETSQKLAFIQQTLLGLSRNRAQDAGASTRIWNVPGIGFGRSDPTAGWRSAAGR
jgi:hypothetical protein